MDKRYRVRADSPSALSRADLDAQKQVYTFQPGDEFPTVNRNADQLAALVAAGYLEEIPAEAAPQTAAAPVKATAPRGEEGKG